MPEVNLIAWYAKLANFKNYRQIYLHFRKTFFF